MAPKPARFTVGKVGDRVRLTRPINNIPTVFCPAGETGTISDFDDVIIYVRMDRYFPELDAWQNRLEIVRWNEDALEIAPASGGG